MSCCGKGRPRPQGPRRYTGMIPQQGGTMEFRLEDRDGSVQVFGSLLEAKGENARRGFTGIIRQVEK